MLLVWALRSGLIIVERVFRVKRVWRWLSSPASEADNHLSNIIGQHIVRHLTNQSVCFYVYLSVTVVPIPGRINDAARGQDRRGSWRQRDHLADPYVRMTPLWFALASLRTRDAICFYSNSRLGRIKWNKNKDKHPLFSGWFKDELTYAFPPDESFGTWKIVSIAVSDDTDILLPRRANDGKDKELPKWIPPLTRSWQPICVKLRTERRSTMRLALAVDSPWIQKILLLRRCHSPLLVSPIQRMLVNSAMTQVLLVRQKIMRYQA